LHYCACPPPLEFLTSRAPGAPTSPAPTSSVLGGRVLRGRGRGDSRGCASCRRSRSSRGDSRGCASYRRSRSDSRGCACRRSRSSLLAHELKARVQALGVRSGDALHQIVVDGVLRSNGAVDTGVCVHVACDENVRVSPSRLPNHLLNLPHDGPGALLLAGTPTLGTTSLLLDVNELHFQVLVFEIALHGR